MTVAILRAGAVCAAGAGFLNLYGQTEVIVSGLPRELHVLDEPDAAERLRSVGFPFPGTRVRDRRGRRRDVPVGQAGEIVVRSDSMFRGYWQDAAATQATLRDGWCRTGDMGRLDRRGLLYLVDRKKDVIISGGENIYSPEVEDAVCAGRRSSRLRGRRRARRPVGRGGLRGRGAAPGRRRRWRRSRTASGNGLRATRCLVDWCWWPSCLCWPAARSTRSVCAPMSQGRRPSRTKAAPSVKPLRRFCAEIRCGFTLCDAAIGLLKLLAGLSVHRDHDRAVRGCSPTTRRSRCWSSPASSPATADPTTTGRGSRCH